MVVICYIGVVVYGNLVFGCTLFIMFHIYTMFECKKRYICSFNHKLKKRSYT